jgi:hypothetical protein
VVADLGELFGGEEGVGAEVVGGEGVVGSHDGFPCVCVCVCRSRLRDEKRGGFKGRRARA